MGCGGCSGCATALPKGCKNNGTCATGGCNKLNAYDWLGNMELPSHQAFTIAEVKFKGGRKAYFRNDKHVELYTGDLVAVGSDNGFHVGCVSLQGEVVRLQMLKKRIENDDKLHTILRKATEADVERLEQARNRELTTLYRTREIIEQLKLKMKLSDVEFQADNTKGTFYYSADERVDFRELIKILAGEFRIRVEMRQISLRQEAGRLGGVGSCGRELCCSTWLTDFKSVPTSAARYQNLSLNPTKLSGQCGRLKCCLNYELETYLDALIDIPEINQPLKTKNGNAVLQKVDIFRKLLWFSFETENIWHAVSAERVHEVIEMNKNGIVPEALTDKSTVIEINEEESVLDFSSGVLSDLDRVGSNRKGKSSRFKKQKRKNRGGNATQNPAKPKNTQDANANGNHNSPAKENGKTRNKPSGANPNAKKSGQGKPPKRRNKRFNRPNKGDNTSNQPPKE